MQLAWSTLATPDWTLDRVAAFTRSSGFDAAELRAFGPGDGQLACEPFLTGPSKINAIFAEEGADVAGIATSARFDEAIQPPIIGRVFVDQERGVRACQRAIDLADALGARFVRVFAFDLPKGDNRRRAIKRIGDRIRLAVDRADKRGVRVVIENGGAFPKAEDLEALMDRADHRLVRACYHAAVGQKAGDTPAEAARRLGSRLSVLRVTDDVNGRPCPLGQGDNACRGVIDAALAAGFDGALVYEYPAMWFTGLPDAEGVLHAAAETLYHWLAPALSGIAPRPMAAAPA